MIIKVYDRDFEYTLDDVTVARAELESIAPDITAGKAQTFGRFEFHLTEDLPEAKQTTFTDWVSENYPDWNVVYR